MEVAEDVVAAVMGVGVEDALAAFFIGCFLENPLMVFWDAVVGVIQRLSDNGKLLTVTVLLLFRRIYQNQSL